MTMSDSAEKLSIVEMMNQTEGWSMPRERERGQLEQNLAQAAEDLIPVHRLLYNSLSDRNSGDEVIEGYRDEIQMTYDTIKFFLEDRMGVDVLDDKVANYFPGEDQDLIEKVDTVSVGEEFEDKIMYIESPGYRMENEDGEREILEPQKVVVGQYNLEEK